MQPGPSTEKCASNDKCLKHETSDKHVKNVTGVTRGEHNQSAGKHATEDKRQETMCNQW